MRRALKKRAEMLRKVRHFFLEREILEVDCPALSSHGSVDAYIDLIEVKGSQSSLKGFLHSSPEYRMKELLSCGSGDIYQLSHVFRDGEFGPKHRPEFMMAEWYRVNFTFREMIEETVEFIRLFIGDLPYHTLTYQEAFQTYAQVDPFETKWDDDRLNEILGIEVEPHLGKDQLTVLTHYPATQSALARVEEPCSLRFEVYYEGMELANGYYELTEPNEHLIRFEKQNAIRESLGKQKISPDPTFLHALERGLPDCCGVAVGFDRLFMLQQGVTDIAHILPVADKK
ncbi:MAG: EF-P lysine aminoacylase EpmA [Waddliaceae bacterium]